MSFDLRLDNGRLLLDDSGSVEIVTGTEKLIQDIIRELTTPQGDNLFDPLRGATLTPSTIGGALDPSIFIPQLKANIIRSLESFKNKQQIEATKQFLSDAEILAEVTNVSVELNRVDPRQIDVMIDVLSQAITPIRVSFTYQVF